MQHLYVALSWRTITALLGVQAATVITSQAPVTGLLIVLPLDERHPITWPVSADLTLEPSTTPFHACSSGIVAWNLRWRLNVLILSTISSSQSSLFVVAASCSCCWALAVGPRIARVSHSAWRQPEVGIVGVEFVFDSIHSRLILLLVAFRPAMKV